MQINFKFISKPFEIELQSLRKVVYHDMQINFKFISKPHRIELQQMSGCLWKALRKGLKIVFYDPFLPGPYIISYDLYLVEYSWELGSLQVGTLTLFLFNLYLPSIQMELSDVCRVGVCPLGVVVLLCACFIDKPF